MKVFFFILREKQSSWQKYLISGSVVHVSILSHKRRHLYIFNSVPKLRKTLFHHLCVYVWMLEAVEGGNGSVAHLGDSVLFSSMFYLASLPVLGG